MEGIVIHQQGFVVDLNESFAKMLGYERDELIGQNLIDLCVHEDDKQNIRDNITKSYAEPYVVRGIKKNGDEFIAEIEARNIEANGTTKRVAAVRDITERKKVEKALQENEEKYRTIFMDSPIGMFRSTFDGRFLEVNPALADILGYSSPDEVLQQIHNIGEQIYVRTEEREQIISKQIGSNKIGHYVNYYRRRDGSIFIANLYLKTIYYESQKPQFLLGFVEDITEIKSAEKTLRESEALLNRSQEIASLGSFIWDLQNDALSWSKNMYAIHGLEEESFAGNLKEVSRQLVHPDDRDRVWAEIGKMIEAKQVWCMEFRIVRPDGEERIMRSSGQFELNNDGNPIVCVGTHQDITERKKAEQELRESEEKFSKAFRSAPILMTITSINDGCFIDVNDAFVSHTGYSRDYSIGKTSTEIGFASQEERDRMISILTKEGSVREIELSVTRADGSNMFCLYSAEIANVKGEKHLLSSAIDITSRKEIEETLRQSELRFRSFVENANDIVYAVSPEGIFTYVSPNWLEFMGEPAEAAIGTSFEPYVHPEDAHLCQEFLDKVLSTGEKQSSVEYRVKHTDGSWRIHISNGSPMKDKAGNTVGYVGIARDITNIKKLQDQIQQAQKMESIGNLAGGIAHDFNNLLFPIIGLSEMLLEDLPSDSVEYQNANEIYKAGIRGSELVKQILAFSRQAEHRLIPMQIQRIAKDVIKLCRSSIPVDINIEHDIQKQCRPALVDPTQIHQVLMNLITNAYHAVETEGGTISITLSEASLGPDDVATTLLEPGRFALLSVCDDGCGIEPVILDRIFEPYFTTKENGKGTGLGLSVVYGIVKEHKGDIKVYSEVGKGTCFKIYLPVIDEPPQNGFAKRSIDAAKGTERILIVDDEKQIVKLEKEILERLGYRITSRISSSEALEAFKAHPERYDLVITDMTMPGMTGIELAKELISIKKDISVIICTGFSERINQNLIEKVGIKGFLMKPVVKSELAEMVRKVLDGAIS